MVDFMFIPPVIYALLHDVHTMSNKEYVVVVVVVVVVGKTFPYFPIFSDSKTNFRTAKILIIFSRPNT